MAISEKPDIACYYFKLPEQYGTSKIQYKTSLQYFLRFYGKIGGKM